MLLHRTKFIRENFQDEKIKNIKNELNLFHIIIDNGVYETTGSQKTITWDMTSIAKQCGYNSIDEIDLKKGTENLNVYFDKIGPIFLRIKVEPGSLPNVPSFNKAPLKIIEDFKNQL